MKRLVLLKTPLKNKLYPYDFIIGAYHQRGGHWDLLIIIPPEAKIVFLNPMGESPYQKRTVLLNWRKYIGQRLLLLPEEGVRTWSLDVPEHSKQQDGSSCGVYCLMFAENYLEGKSIQMITQKEANQKRQKVAQTLMMFEGFMEGCCPCCGYHINEEQSITCSVCFKRFHKKSHCVGEKTAQQQDVNDFICEVCT